MRIANGTGGSKISKTTTGSTLNKELYFPTPIYFIDLDDPAALNAELTKRITARRDESPDGITRSNVQNVGAWHSPADMHRRPEYHALVAMVLDAASTIFEDQGYHPDYEPAMDLMWANVSPRYGFNRYHVHPGVLWSGVYYVKAAPESGRIIFADPRAQARVIEPYYPEDAALEPEAWSEVYFEPLVGRLIVFPAWLGHSVEPNLAEGDASESERISVSFNIFQRRKGMESNPISGPVVRSDLEP